MATFSDATAVSRITARFLSTELEDEFRQEIFDAHRRRAALVVGLVALLRVTLILKQFATLELDVFLANLEFRALSLLFNLVILGALLRLRSKDSLDGLLLAFSASVIGGMIYVHLSPTDAPVTTSHHSLDVVMILVVSAALPSRFLFQAMSGIALALAALHQLWLREGIGFMSSTTLWSAYIFATGIGIMLAWQSHVAERRLFRSQREMAERYEQLRKLADLRAESEASLRESEQRETLLKEVAIGAAHAGGVDEAFVAALDSVCAFTGWPVGHVYVIAPDDPERLDPTTLWHVPSEERFDVFKEVTERTPFVLGEGLPGRILSSCGPSWIVDVTKDPNFPRAKLADDLGVKGAFGFPVLIGKELVAVLEFFSEEPQDPDETLLEMVGQVGMQLGGSIARQQAGEQLLEAKEAADTANKELAERYEQLRELADLRDSLTHMIVHDLRSPLTGIFTSLQLLEMEADRLGEESAEDVRGALHGARALMQMITALLDVCKLEAGEMTLTLKGGDLVATAEESLESLSGLVRARNISLQGAEGGVRAEYDPELTGRIVANLVSNALRFTPEQGSVSVRVIGANGRARVEVQDEGPGIPEEYRDKIFEKFGQVEGKGSSAGGTGLGLAFCKLAVEAHGGEIGVDSVVGEGSTFWFELPT